ncbi:murein biosynthesis integral membrane protein MurJ [Planctomicrobium sp. SH664]|uniref:murein biosynthesis integral membrane protein MurJ n=1 Tax=Planctomicrobium sp. SH664 TaxID=3448125 RepID=UPI003F5BFE7E
MKQTAGEPVPPGTGGTAGEGRSLFANLRLVSLGTFTSRILGLIRDIKMFSLFGAGTTLDAFVVAFRIPNLARQLFGEGALTTAFLPLFIRTRDQHGDAAARSMLWAVAFVLAVGLSALVLLAEVALSATVAWADLSESTRLLVRLLQIMLPYMVLICLSALMSATLYALRQFLWPALVPVVLNVVWLIALVLAWTLLESPEQQALLIAGAVTVAGVAQLALPWWILKSYGMNATTAWSSAWPHVRQVFLTIIPVLAGLAVLQVSSVLDGLLAWALARPDQGGPAWCEAWGIRPLIESGTAAALYAGQRMYQFPLGVFGVALGTVLYPRLAQHAQQQDWPGLRGDLERGIRIVIVIGFPASVGLILLAEPLTYLFRDGRFSGRDAQLVSRMIAIYGAGVWSYISMNILNRAFYAVGDRITPLKLGLLALGVNLVLNLLLVFRFGGPGLAMGNVIATTLQVILTLYFLNRSLGPLNWRELARTAIKGVAATAVMWLACRGAAGLLPPQEGMSLVALGVPCVVGVLVYWIAAKMTGIRELDDLLRRS